jgi:hypothetical protein
MQKGGSKPPFFRFEASRARTFCATYSMAGLDDPAIQT